MKRMSEVENQELKLFKNDPEWLRTMQGVTGLHDDMTIETPKPNPDLTFIHS